jgi:hypothetical protein
LTAIQVHLMLWICYFSGVWSMWKSRCEKLHGLHPFLQVWSTRICFLLICALEMCRGVLLPLL